MTLDRLGRADLAHATGAVVEQLTHRTADPVAGAGAVVLAVSVSIPAAR